MLAENTHDKYRRNSQKSKINQIVDKGCRLHLVNFDSRICRRAFLGEEGGERWIRVRLFVSNTDSKVLTVGCILNSSGKYTYLPRVE